MPSRHKRHPIPLRLPEGDEAWLRTHAEQTGHAINAIIRQAIQDLRARESQRCVSCGSFYPAGQIHHCMPGEPGDPRDAEYIGGYRPGLEE